MLLVRREPVIVRRGRASHESGFFSGLVDLNHELVLNLAVCLALFSFNSRSLVWMCFMVTYVFNASRFEHDRTKLRRRWRWCGWCWWIGSGIGFSSCCRVWRRWVRWQRSCARRRVFRSRGGASVVHHFDSKGGSLPIVLMLLRWCCRLTFCFLINERGHFVI